MNAPALLQWLRQRDVRLRVGENRLLVDAPANMVTAELKDILSKYKVYLLSFLKEEQYKLEEANKRGLIIRWSKEPSWIALHDPTSGEWHEVRASEYLPGIVRAARAGTQQATMEPASERHPKRH